VRVRGKAVRRTTEPEREELACPGGRSLYWRPRVSLS
jgi:hypothetical protein